MCPYTVSIKLHLCACVMVVGLVGCATTPSIPPEFAQCMTQANRFIYYDNGTMLDTCTHLMWMVQDFRNLEGRPPHDWYEAIHWSDTINLRRYGGYSDWRSPMSVEYQTIYAPQQRNSSYAGRAVGYAAEFADGGGVRFWTPEFFNRELKDWRAVIDF